MKSNLFPLTKNNIHSILFFMILFLTIDCSKVKYYRIDEDLTGLWTSTNLVNKLTIEIPLENKPKIKSKLSYQGNTYTAFLTTTYHPGTPEIIQFNWKDTAKQIDYRISVVPLGSDYTVNGEMTGIMEQISYSNDEKNDINSLKTIILSKKKN